MNIKPSKFFHLVKKFHDFTKSLQIKGELRIENECVNEGGAIYGLPSLQMMVLAIDKENISHQHFE
jgi:hypothetical protein